jgi:hypothetical protein
LSVNLDLERFLEFKDAEFRSLEIINPLEMHLVFAVQDKARDFDWITLRLEFLGVKNARLLENSKLSFLDMSDGVTIIKNENSLAFAIGEYNTMNTIENAPLFIIASDMKHKEEQF